jgi:hypothetical protein
LTWKRKPMDLQTFYNLGATALLGIVGWFVRDIKQDQKDTAEALAEFRLEVAKDYVTHTDLADIKRLLERIRDILDQKADKA